MRRLLSIAVLLTLLIGTSGREAEAATVERDIAVGDVTRSYVIHIPDTWDRAKPIAVLLVFHGAGSSPEDMIKGAGFDALAASTPMLVVYPRAPAPARRFDVDPPAGRRSADVDLVDALLARLRERFPVDARRVYATGFSNGAALCYRLAAERPRVFAAIAPVAGYLPSLGDEMPAVPVPLLHVHGTADRRVGPPTLGAIDRTAVATWARRNGATRGPVIEASASMGALSVRRASYAGPTPRSDARLLLVEGAEHEWPGGPAGVISRAVLEFFAAHPRDDDAPAGPAGAAAPAEPAGPAFGSTDPLRWSTPEGARATVADRPYTLFRWWTNACPHCVGSVPALARVEDRYRARGLRLVAVYHPKGAPLSDEGARAYARRLGFQGSVAFDDRWTKYIELRDRFGFHRATSISVLVDARGAIRWTHPGPRIEEGSADLAELDALLDRLLPAAPSRDGSPAR